MTTRFVAGSEAWRLGPGWPGHRCGARTRSGNPCKNPSVSGNKRCRMHGGKGSGAPAGKRHGGFKHGRYTKEYVASARRDAATLRALARLGKALGMFG